MKDGGPAFPNDDAQLGGLAKLDFFAALAQSSIIFLRFPTRDAISKEDAEAIAKDAFLVGAAMLAERERLEKETQ